MKYLISEEYATVYYLDEGSKQLAGFPIWGDNTFETEESFIVERPHDEIPEKFFEEVIEKLQ